MAAARGAWCQGCAGPVSHSLFCSICDRVLCIPCDAQLHPPPLLSAHPRAALTNVLYNEPRSQFSVFYFAGLPRVPTLPGNGDAVRSFLREKAARGVVLVLLTELCAELSQELKVGKSRVATLVEEAIAGGIVRLSPTIFRPADAERMIALALPELSVEALVWAVRSIRNDAMQPVEALVHCRLRQCFGLSAPYKSWRAFVDELLRSPQLLQRLNAHKDALGEIELRAIDDLVLIGLRGEEWSWEDGRDIAAEDPLHGEFVEFITTRLQDLNSGIQGGKYGCALFTQSAGPPALRRQSLGVLVALVKAALNAGVLVHRKTLIVLPAAEPRQCLSPGRLRKLQTEVVELLSESGAEGVVLAQLPFVLTRRMGHPLDLHRLGFGKLKDFLETMGDRVLMRQSPQGYIRVSLRRLDAEPTLATLQPVDWDWAHHLRSKLLVAVSAAHGEVELSRLEAALGLETTSFSQLGVDNLLDFILEFCGEKLQIALSRDRFKGHRVHLVQARFPPLFCPALEEATFLGNFPDKDRERGGFEFQVIAPMAAQLEPESEEPSEEPAFDAQSLRRFNRLLDAHDD